MSESDAHKRFAYKFGKFEFVPDRRLLSRDGLPVRIGSRAMTILQVFLEHPGMPITTEALIAAVWKNRFVEKGSVKVNVAALRKMLGKTDDGREHIITEPGRGYIFVADVVIPGSEALSHEEPARFLNFPARLVSIIGREELLARLSLQNARGRLLTITGPGGIGKTTVSIAIAERVAKEYADGATCLDLAPLNDPALLSATIAAQMGVLIRSADPIDDIVARLRHRQSLILMDNCEHLVDALSHIIEKLLSNAPLVDIIATSREPLLISAEKIEKIEPLTIPPDGICLSPETAMSASAVRLFVARAQATTSDFLLTTDNVHLVTSICRQLDGLPLAIELAGALLASLSLEEIQIKIDSHFHELTLGYRTAPKRHQSLLNLLEWSYGLLPPAEKKALAELSIFRRSFVLDGAIKLLQLDDSSAIGLLTSLVRKSLIVSNDGDSPRSYRMLETTRAFATQKLNQTGRRDEIARRHAEHITDMFGLYDPIDVGAHRKLVTGVLDDQRSALEWALSPAGDLRIATKLTIKAAPVLFGMGLEAEHSAQFERTLIKVLSADETFDREKMELEKMELYAAPPAWGGHAVRDVRRWSKILQKILQLAQKRDDVEFRMRARYGLFLSHIQSGRVDLALVQAKNMLEDAARVRDDGYIAMAHRMSGLCNHTLGNHNEAMQSVAALMGRHSRATNSKRSAPLTNFGLFDHAIIKDVFIARALLLDGQVAESVSTIESAAQRSHEVGHLPTVFYTYVHGACLIALMLRRAELSKRFVKLASSVNSIYTKQDPVVCQWSPLFSGWLKILEGDFEIGMSTIQEALVFLGDDFAKLNPTNTPFYGALAEGQLANGQFNAAVSTLDQALKNAHDGWGSWYDPELLRLKAEALSALKQPANEIEHAFKNSLRIAQEQGALLWQFKSAVSLADFYVSLGRVSLARKIIQPLYKTFSANPDLPWFQRATEIISNTER